LKPSKAQRIPAPLLQKFAEGCYVDSPVYFDAPSWVRRLNWAKLDRLLALGGRGEGRRLLDFACGNGIMLPTWATNFPGAVGIDIHITAAKRVQEFFSLQNVHLAKTDGPSLPFLSGSFDLVFAASVLEHFAELTSPLREIHRVLRVGGQMLFLCPNENRWYGWGRRVAGYKKPPDHYHTADEVIALVRRFFGVEEISCFPSWVPSPLALYKMGKALKY
jgi:SAM-dependent methyltransferase